MNARTESDIESSNSSQRENEKNDRRYIHGLGSLRRCNGFCFLGLCCLLCCSISLTVAGIGAIVSDAFFSVECSILGKCVAPVCRPQYAPWHSAAIDDNHTANSLFGNVKSISQKDLGFLLHPEGGSYWANIILLFTLGDTAVCQYALNDNLTAEGFPSAAATAYITWEGVHRMLTEEPLAIANGSLQRGKWDFGYFLVNDALFKGTPLEAFALDISNDKHEIVAPAVWQWFAGATWDRHMIQQRVRTLLENKTSFGEPDMQTWTMQLLWKLLTGRELPSKDAADLVAHQVEVFGFSLLPQAVAEGLSTKADALRMKNDAWREKLRNSSNEFVDDLLASEALASILFAGGPLVPLYLNSGLATMFAENSPLAASDRQLTEDTVEAFAMEVIRKFPPVNAVPNRKPDGHQLVYSIAMAQVDPDVWGSDAQAFKLRPVEKYHKYINLSWGQEANEGVPSRLHRGCPAMNLVKTIGREFFNAWRLMQDQWVLQKPVVFFGAAPFATSVRLSRTVR